MKALLAFIKYPIKAPLIAVACTIGFVSVAFAADATAATGAAGILSQVWDVISTPAAISGIVALLMAVLPQGTPGSIWDTVRTVLNFVASNWGNAKNQVKES